MRAVFKTVVRKIMEVAPVAAKYTCVNLRRWLAEVNFTLFALQANKVNDTEAGPERSRFAVHALLIRLPPRALMLANAIHVTLQILRYVVKIKGKQDGNYSPL